MFMIYGKSMEILVEFLWNFSQKYGYFYEDIRKIKISKWKHCGCVYAHCVAKERLRLMVQDMSCVEPELQKCEKCSPNEVVLR